MASETFVSAMMLITAVVACAILITAVFPIVWNMVSTFSSASHETDTRMRTDFKIVVKYTNSSNYASIYLKNIGSNPISASEIQKSDVIFGKAGRFSRFTYQSVPTGGGQWTYDGYNGDDSSYDFNKNQIWDQGETIHITVITNSGVDAMTSGDLLYFQFVTPNGIMRDTEFTAT